jgi:hypothetical protein
MTCVVCDAPVSDDTRAPPLSCKCGGTRAGILHLECAKEWRTVSGRECVMQCDLPAKPSVREELQEARRVLVNMFRGWCVLCGCILYLGSRSWGHTLLALVHFSCIACSFRLH